MSYLQRLEDKMPLHISIKINRETINELHIARVKGGTDPDDINEYVVVEGPEPTRMEDWIIDSVPFKHRYGDGAEACVQRAMEALYGKVD